MGKARCRKEGLGKWGAQPLRMALKDEGENTAVTCPWASCPGPGGELCFRARRRARESALPKLPGEASAVPSGRFTATRRKCLMQHSGRMQPAAPAMGSLLVGAGSSRIGVG